MWVRQELETSPHTGQGLFLEVVFKLFSVIIRVYFYLVVTRAFPPSLFLWLRLYM